jgi:hypothetical protein
MMACFLTAYFSLTGQLKTKAKSTKQFKTLALLSLRAKKFMLQIKLLSNKKGLK